MGKENTVVFFPKGRYDFWPDHCIEKVYYYESNTTVNNPRRCAIDNLTFTGNNLTLSHRYQPWHPRKFSASLESCKGVIIRDNVMDSGILGRNIRILGMKMKELQMGKAQFLLE